MTPRYCITFAAAALFAQPVLATSEQPKPPANAEIAAPFQGTERASSKPSAFAGRQEFDVTGGARVSDAAAAVGASPLARSDTRARDVGGTAGEAGEGAVAGGDRDSYR